MGEFLVKERLFILLRRIVSQVSVEDNTLWKLLPKKEEVASEDSEH